MKYSLDFLCWVNRCLYPYDFINELVEQGIDKIEATIMVNSYGNKPLDILKIYQDWAIVDSEWKRIIETYLNKLLKEYWLNKKDRRKL